MKQLLFFALLIGIGRATMAQFGTTPMENYLLKAYYDLSSEDYYGKLQWLFGDCASDFTEVGGEFGGNDFPAAQALMYHDLDSSNSILNLYGRRAFTMIYACNQTILLAPGSSLDENLITRYVAEAKFIRALNYFNLTCLFDSVPLLTDDFTWPLVVEGDAMMDYDHSTLPTINSLCNTIYEVYSQIKDDLTEVISTLPEQSELSEDQKFRATKGAAQALLAKVLLYESSYAKNYPGDSRFEGLEERWDEALELFQSVIDSGGYEIVGINGETFNTWWDNSYLYVGGTPGYRYIFTVSGNDSPESVFTCRDLLPEYISWQWYGLNVITVYTTVRNYFNDGISESAGGWGFNCPTDSLLKEFEEDDPRQKVTLGEEGDSIYLDFDVPGWYAMDLYQSPSGMIGRKYECSPDEFWNVANSVFRSPINIPVIRYADVVLMAAEAALATGDNALALIYVNMVRTRARNSGTTGVPADLVAITFKDIVHERAVELALEGHRFFDLVRWGLAEEYLDGNYRATHDSIATFEAGIDEFYPKPAFILSPGAASIHSEEFANIQLFPNPASDILFIQSDLKAFKVTIYDIGGKTMYTETQEAGSSAMHTINLSSFEEGIYLIKISNADYNVTEKIIKVE